MEFKKAIEQADFFSVMQVRNLVFICEQQVPANIEIDDKDQTCDHYYVKDENKVIATLRIVNHCNFWHIGRVAVLKEHRNKNLGSFMLQEIEKLAIANQIEKLLLGAQVSAIPFYKKNGYQVVGDLYIDANIEHFQMEKTLL